MLAYHSDPKIKSRYLKRVRAHAKADEIIKGQYWENGRGCAVGCTIHSGNHSAYETELGIPRLLAKLEDGIFEGLPIEQAKVWPEKFLKVIKPGVDLSQIGPKFLIWLLGDVIQFAKPAGKIAIQAVIDLYKRQLKGEKITPTEWDTAAASRKTARETARIKQAEKLLELLKECK